VTGTGFLVKGPVKDLAPAESIIRKNWLPASETFRRQSRLVPPFGRGIAKKAAVDVLSRGIISRAVPYLGWALTAYEIYDFIHGTVETVIPRDITHPDDRQLDFSGAGWQHGYTTWTSPHPWDFAPNPPELWVQYPPGVFNSPGVRDTDGYSGTLTWLEELPVATPGAIVMSPIDVWNAQSTMDDPNLMGYSRYDARAAFTQNDIGYVDLEAHWRIGVGTPLIEWTHPERVAPARVISVPITIPLPVRYAEIPYRVPNEFLSPQEQTQWGPGLQYQWPWEIGPGEPLTVDPTVGVPPDVIIGIDPATGNPVDPISPNTDPDVTTDTDNPPTKDPPPRTEPSGKTKEQKVKVKRAGVELFIRNVAGQFTEFGDALECFWTALPKQFRPGYYVLHNRHGGQFLARRWNASMRQRAEAVYKHADKLDLTQLFECILANEVQDMLIGKQSAKLVEWMRKHNPYYRRLKRPLGLESGPWDTFYSDYWASKGNSIGGAYAPGY
jgi:hypothetical protein